MQGLPSGPLAECACCARASQACPLHSINIDFNFGLVHNARCGSTSVRLAPPNRRLYLHSAEYDALIADSANAAAADAEADRACSDFNAAKVLARTSETVRALLAHYWRLLRGSCFAPPTSSKVCTFVCVCGGGSVLLFVVLLWLLLLLLLWLPSLGGRLGCLTLLPGPPVQLSWLANAR